MSEVARKYFTDARSSVAIFIPVYDYKGEVVSIAPAGDFAEKIIPSFYAGEGKVDAYSFDDNCFIAIQSDVGGGEWVVMHTFFCESFQGFIFTEHTDPVQAVKNAHLTVKALYALDEYECATTGGSLEHNQSNLEVIRSGLNDARKAMPKQEPQKLG